MGIESHPRSILFCHLNQSKIMAGICKAKGRRKGRHGGKRNAQNQRTFNNVTKRREAHAKAHGMTMAEFLSLFNPRKWISRPTKDSKLLS